MMRVLALATAISWSLSGQTADLGPHANLMMPSGSAAREIPFTIEPAPSKGDRFVVEMGSAKIGLTLLLPDGRRVTADRAPDDLSWMDNPAEPPLGDSDGGHWVAIIFNGPAKAGKYVLELKGANLSSPRAVEARYISHKREYDEAMNSLPGFQRAGPVTILSSSPALFQLDLQAAKGAALIDVVVTDENAKVALTLPDGRVLDRIADTSQADDASQKDRWRKLKQADDIDPPASMIGVAGMLLPEPGTHYVIGFDQTLSGRYSIRVTSSQPQSIASAAFVPVERALQQLSNGLQHLGDPPPGQVAIVPYPLPDDCWRGDKLDLQFELKGAPVADPPKIEVTAETKELLPDSSPGTRKEGPPFVEHPSVTFARDASGRYRGTFTPTRTGFLRIGIQVSGVTADKNKFSENVILGVGFEVRPLVARFLSLTEKPIPTPTGETFARLEVTAHLDVVVPGKYTIKLNLNGPHDQDVLGQAEKELAVGPQSITASFPASQMHYLGGPFTIDSPIIYREAPGQLAESVATGNVKLTTAAYRPEQWDRGPIWTEPQVNAHGIDPAPSGRFRLVEVTLDAFSPGGDCAWNGSLVADKNPGELVGVVGVLPKGKTTLSFVFDAAAIADAPKVPRAFLPSLQCDSMWSNERPPFPQVSLDPAEFEPQAVPFHLSAGNVSLAPGSKIEWPTISVVRKANEQLPRGLVFTVGAAPGIQAAVIVRGEFATLSISAAPDAKPGRYFVPVSATAEGQTATTDLVVDVTPVTDLAAKNP